MNMTSTASSRSLSLDIFRGMTVCFMIIVNTPGSELYIYSPLRHAHWNGFTPTDLVFPSFLFAVGNAMSFAMKKYESQGQAAVLWKILKRTFLIFLIGYLIYWFPFFHPVPGGGWELNPLSHTRIMGVLERIALCYGMASLLIYYCSPRTVCIIAAILLIGYWIILLVGGVPGADPFGMTTNAGYRLDKWIMGEDHMYHGEGVAFDPEGILSTFPAIVNVIAGYFAGVFISRKGRTYEGLAQLLLLGCLSVFLADTWGLAFPINKKLWTSSYVLYTIGIDMILLSFLLYILEFRQKTGWTPFFAVFGKNPLFIYILSELLVVVLFTIRVSGEETLFGWINGHIFQPAAPGPVGSLLFAITYMLLCWCVGKGLDKKKIYIRV